MAKFVFLLALATSIATASAANWAVLVAGSRSYYNYRHQSDVCHSYQVLMKNNFPADHIITMFYDDIANSPSNPTRGIIINEPNGPDVYRGCAKDYTGSDVTPSNFLKVLSGQPTGRGTGRVVESTSEDNIFVFFSDHGAVGLIAFPSSELYAVDLNNTLTQMHANNRFNKLLFYTEACEAGSMFNRILSTNINVLAVTASDPAHSSYAIYYDQQRRTYLADAFSINWMHDSEGNSVSRTVGAQFAAVVNMTDTSQVCAYGDMSIKNDALSAFQASLSDNTRTAPLPKGEVVSSRDVEMKILQKNVASAETAEEIDAATTALYKAMARRKAHDTRMESLINVASALKDASSGSRVQALRPQVSVGVRADCNPPAVLAPYCLKEMVETFKAACGPFDDYSLKYAASLNEMCNNGIRPAQMAGPMAATCATYPILF